MKHKRKVYLRRGRDRRLGRVSNHNPGYIESELVKMISAHIRDEIDKSIIKNLVMYGHP
jgi:uncharacterized protein (UPF0218 family)